MRDAFAAEITALAKTDERVVLLSGDIGNRMFDTFKANNPKRFFNCGVAEANMISVAAGLALTGLRPFVYTINSFLTTRCYEQIRLDLCYHNLPVVLVGVGGGLAYASLGATHHSCEDISILRVLPRMTVICPGDAAEVRLATRAALQQNGPVYIRLGKKGEPKVHAADPDFKIGRGIVLREGDGVCLISTGNLLPVALHSADVLQTKGVKAGVVSMHTVKPLDQDLLKKIFSRYAVVATVEEHSVIGGLGGAVAEWLADNPGLKGRLCRIGTPDDFMHEAGEQEFAREHWGLTPEAIASKLLAIYGRTA